MASQGALLKIVNEAGTNLSIFRSLITVNGDTNASGGRDYGDGKKLSPAEVAKEIIATADDIKRKAKEFIESPDAHEWC